MKNGMRKAGIATAMLAAAGAMVTIGGAETASAQVPTHTGGSGAGAPATSTKTASTKTTPTHRSAPKPATGTSAKSGSVQPKSAVHTTSSSHTTSSATKGTSNSRSATFRSSNNSSGNNGSGNNGSGNNGSSNNGSGSAKAASASNDSSNDQPAKASEGSSKGQAALQEAKSQIGKPYSWGAAGPGSYDCSGLTAKAWKAAGVNLPHSSQQQFKQGPRVSMDNLKPGDLVFFYGPNPHHVGVYAGHGKVIDAQHPGTNVRYDKIDTMPVAGATRPA